jgi:hypothetical protein
MTIKEILENGIYENCGKQYIGGNVVKEVLQLHEEKIKSKLPDSEIIRQKAKELDEKDFDKWWWESVFKNVC